MLNDPIRRAGGQDHDTGLHVLLVDDDQVDRMAVRRALRGAVSIDEVADADAAFAALSGGGYDCVLLDYLLPGADGLELMRRLRAVGNPVPVVVLTGRGDESLAVAMLKEGAADYLTKDGADRERLLWTLRNAVTARRAALRGEAAASGLRALVEATTATVGHDFFAALVRHLAHACNAAHAVVARLADDRFTLRPLAAWSRAGLHPPRDWMLAGSPCRLACATAGSVVVDDARALASPLLRALRAERYRGIALRDAEGGLLGVLAVLDEAPPADLAQREDLLSVLAARAAAELRRADAEEALATALRRERALAACARELLVRPLGDAMPAALAHLLRAVDRDRALWFVNTDGDADQAWERLVVDRKGRTLPPGQRRLSWRHGLRRWQLDLADGRGIDGAVHLLPQVEREHLAADGVQSVLVLPLIVHQRWQGLLRFDDLRRPGGWSRPALHLLRAGVDLVAAWLERQTPEGAAAESAVSPLLATIAWRRVAGE